MHSAAVEFLNVTIPTVVRGGLVSVLSFHVLRHIHRLSPSIIQSFSFAFSSSSCTGEGVSPAAIFPPSLRGRGKCCSPSESKIMTGYDPSCVKRRIMVFLLDPFLLVTANKNFRSTYERKENALCTAVTAVTDALVAIHLVPINSTLVIYYER